MHENIDINLMNFECVVVKIRPILNKTIYFFSLASRGIDHEV